MPPWGLPGMARPQERDLQPLAVWRAQLGGNMLRLTTKPARRVKFPRGKDLNTTVKINETHTVMVDTKLLLKNETNSVVRTETPR